MPGLGGGAAKKKKTSYDVFLDFVRVDKVDKANVNVDDIFSLECFNAWVQSRARVPKKATESFRRALTAHVRGTDLRKPFPPPVEHKLLEKLREQNPWVHFDNIGGYGFRGKGYWETQGESEGSSEQQNPPVRAEAQLEGLTDTSEEYEAKEAMHDACAKETPYPEMSTSFDETDADLRSGPVKKSKLAVAAELMIQEPEGLELRRSLKRKSTEDDGLSGNETNFKTNSSNDYLTMYDPQQVYLDAENVVSAAFDAIAHGMDSRSQLYGSSTAQIAVDLEAPGIVEFTEDKGVEIALGGRPLPEPEPESVSQTVIRHGFMPTVQKPAQNRGITELNRIADDAKDLEEECRKLYYFMKTAKRNHSTYSSRYAAMHKDTYTDEQLKEFIMSMRRRTEYFSPRACFLLDKLLRTQPLDIRLSRNFLEVSMQDRKFDPNKPVGKFVQLYSTRIVIDTDQASRDCFKGDIRGLNSVELWTSRIEAMARVPVWGRAIREGDELWLRKRLYRLDGSIGVFLFYYDVRKTMIHNRGQRYVVSLVQDVTEKYEEYAKLPPLLF